MKNIILLVLFFTKAALSAEAIGFTFATADPKGGGDGKMFHLNYTTSFFGEYLLFSGGIGTLHFDNAISNTIAYQTDFSFGGGAPIFDRVRIEGFQGFAVVNRTFRGLQSRWQLPTTIKLLFGSRHKIGLIFRHYSNGTTKTRNIGINYFGLEFQWKLN